MNIKADKNDATIYVLTRDCHDGIYEQGRWDVVANSFMHDDGGDYYVEQTTDDGEPVAGEWNVYIKDSINKPFVHARNVTAFGSTEAEAIDDFLHGMFSRIGQDRRWMVQTLASFEAAQKELSE